jgi:23S rRNA (cytidine1920-2'-O)/16S rRNA (cytidine1409-2'-O)-methyltransferase
MLADRWPDLADPEAIIRAGWVYVDGFPMRNPDSLVAAHVSIVVRPPAPLQGEQKLGAALANFRPPVAGGAALDVGASTGGFTRALLAAGAARVYAVDVGYGQLLGSLRQDPRVVVLERTNLARLGPELIPEPITLVTIDVSFLSLARAVPQLARVPLAPRAHLIALVKPMFELGLASLPPVEQLPAAVEAARQGITATGWEVQQVIDSPVRGHNGAVEFLLHAVRP